MKASKKVSSGIQSPTERESGLFREHKRKVSSKKCITSVSIFKKKNYIFVVFCNFSLLGGGLNCGKIALSRHY